MDRAPEMRGAAKRCGSGDRRYLGRRILAAAFRRRQTDWSPALPRCLHLEAVASADVIWPAHAADGVELVGIDLVTVEQRLEHMEAQDFAEHENAATGPVTNGHNLVKPALHLGLALGNAWRFDEIAGQRRQA